MIIMKERKEENQSKMKIGAESAMTAKVRDMKEKTREGRITRMRKEVVGCVQAVVGKKKFLV